MELKTMQITNFLGIAEATVTFNKRGLTLLEGGNGAGKSTIFEAVYWCLYGKTKRGLTGDEVINDVAGKNCGVSLVFDNFKLVRFRKHKELGGTGLRLWNISPDSTDLTELTKGTAKETQALIEDIIKMSELTFTKVAYFGQADVAAFAGLSDTQLKEVFEQALGLTCLSRYADKAKAYKGGVEQEMAKQKLTIERTEMASADASERISLLTRMMGERKEEYDRELSRLESDDADTVREVNALVEKTSSDTEEYNKKLADVRTLIAKRTALKDKREAVKTRYDSAIRTLAGIQAATKSKKIELENKLKELKMADEKIGSPCGECGKAFEKADIEPLQTSLKRKLAVLLEEYKAKAAEEERAGGDVEGLKAIFPAIDKMIEGFNDAQIELARLEERVKAGEDSKKRIETLKTKRIEIANMRAEVMGRLRFARDKEEINALSETVEENVNRITKVRNDLLALEQEIEGAEMLAEIFSNTGLKSYLFDSVTPELNRIIGEYIAILNEDISVEVSTVTPLKDGSYREKFGILVENGNGAKSYAGCSAGEQQLVNLATALGFNTICRSISEGGVNLLFLDEPLENLDEGNSERAIELCQKFISAVPNVFLVSHSPAIKDLLSARITIEKVGGVTRFSC